MWPSSLSSSGTFSSPRTPEPLSSQSPAPPSPCPPLAPTDLLSVPVELPVLGISRDPDVREPVCVPGFLTSHSVSRAHPCDVPACPSFLLASDVPLSGPHASHPLRMDLFPPFGYCNTVKSLACTFLCEHLFFILLGMCFVELLSPGGILGVT